MSTVRWEWLLAQADGRGFDWDARAGCFRHRGQGRQAVAVSHMLEIVAPASLLGGGELRRP